MSTFNESENIERIFKELSELGYPIMSRNEFYSNILHPSKIRYKTIEWLIYELSNGVDFNIIDEYMIILGECDMIDLYTLVFKNFGIELDKSISLSDYKKAISGISSNQDSAKILINLINFVKINRNIQTSTSYSINSELKNVKLIINYLADNKSELFKEKIRLFPPEVKLIKKNKEDKTEFNINEISTKINEYQKVVSKLNKKLAKLNTLSLNYEIIEFEDVLELKNKLIEFEKKLDNFIKDYNQLYSKGIKYISKEKMPTLQYSVDEFKSKYDMILALSSSLEEIFSLHNKILNKKIID